MKIIKPSYQFMEDHKKDPMKHIEQIGRTCYKSEDRITDESAPMFVGMLVDRKHWAMIEHFIFIAKLDFHTFSSLKGLNPHFANFTSGKNGYIMSYSARSIMDMRNNTDDKGLVSLLTKIIEDTAFVYNCPELFGIKEGHIWTKPDFRLAFLIDNDKALEYFSTVEKMAHCWFSVKFTCDRGVSHEFVRHRVMSFAQESTRYCNYTNNKFGSELTFIEPRFWLKDSHEYFKWLKIMEVSENMYNELIALDSSPQEARSILPNSLKTELCMTGRFKDWYNFFLLRSDGAAHPQAKELAAPLLKECKDRYNEFVGLKEVY